MKTETVIVGELRVGDVCRGSGKDRVRFTDKSPCGPGQVFLTLDDKPDGIYATTTEVERYATNADTE